MGEIIAFSSSVCTPMLKIITVVSKMRKFLQYNFYTIYIKIRNYLSK